MNVDHHDPGSPDKPRSYLSRIGHLERVTATADALRGNLVINPHHPLSEQVVWDAQNCPTCLGLSHNVMAKTSRNGRELIVEEISRVMSVDLVADPATSGGLFEADCPHCQGREQDAAVEMTSEKYLDIVLGVGHGRQAVRERKTADTDTSRTFLQKITE